MEEAAEVVVEAGAVEVEVLARARWVTVRAAFDHNPQAPRASVGLSSPQGVSRSDNWLVR